MYTLTDSTLSIKHGESHNHFADIPVLRECMEAAFTSVEIQFHNVHTRLSPQKV